MLKNHIIMSFRNLWKNRFLSSLNLIGLSIGISSVMSLIFSVYAYYSANDPVEGQDNIYYLSTVLKNGNRFSSTTYPLLDKIVETSPDVVAATHIQGWSQPWLQIGEKEYQEQTDYVDSSFFDVFSLPLKYGNKEAAFAQKNSIVLTHKVSERIFGDQNPVGKTITANDSLSVTITGVLEPISPYASFRFGVLFPTKLLEDKHDFKKNSGWDNIMTPAYFLLRPNANIKQFETLVTELVKNNYSNPTNIDTIRAINFADFRMEAIPIVGIIVKGSIAAAAFILLIVLVNLLNLNTSTLFRRTKDIAVRKILGGTKKSVITQFCIENGILVFTSFVISALLFSLVLLPRTNDLYGADFGKIAFSLKNDYPVLIYALILGIVITLTVSVLPTLRFISVPISSGIKGKINTVKSNFFLRNSFITLQFVIAILFICVAIILNQQIDYMKAAPLGFNGENVVVGKLDLEYKNKEIASSQFNGLLNDLKANANVLSFSTSEVVPSQYPHNYTEYFDESTNTDVRVRYSKVDADYLKTLEVPLLMGRHFNENIDKPKDYPVIINNTTFKALGWASIEGKRLKTRNGTGPGNPVIGVMEDFHFEDLQTAVEPMVHYFNGKKAITNNLFISVKTIPGKEVEIQQLITSAFNSVNTRRNYEYEFLNNKVSSQYNLMEGILTTINTVAILTIFISCLGLFGLISFMAKRRVKEIGVRKVLGSSVFKIIMLLSKEYVLLTCIAALIAFPLAWYAMNTWLQQFAISISIKWWMFGLAGLLGLLITSFTVGIQAVKSALANPVKSLRTE